METAPRYNGGSNTLRLKDRRSDVHSGTLRVRDETRTRSPHGSYGTGPARHQWRKRRFNPPRRISDSDSNSESSKGSTSDSSESESTTVEESDSDLGIWSNWVRERPLGSSKRHREGQVVDSSQADLPPTVVRRLQRTRSIDLAGVQGPEQLRRDAGMVRRSPTPPPSERSFIPAMYKEVVVTSLGTPDMLWPAIPDKGEMNRRVTRFLHFNRQWIPIGPQLQKLQQVWQNLDDI